MKTLIQDQMTGAYYCVPMTDKDAQGNPTTGPNDFPYWSKNIMEAYVFDWQYLAENEMNMNDLTEDGKKRPMVVSYA